MSDIVDKYSIICDEMTLLTPFVVSKKHKTLYLHIAKTGGSTITKTLVENGMDDGVLTDRKTPYEEKLKYFEEVCENWDDYYKFTMIRNKYEQLVSHWHYDKQPGKTFKRFIHKILKNHQGVYGRWIDQYYLTILNGNSIFDHVGRYDNYQEDFSHIMNSIGIKDYDAERIINGGRYNKSRKTSDYYGQEEKDVVYNKFKDEIDYYGFEL